MKQVISAASALLAALMVGCGDPAGPDTTPSSVVLSAAAASVVAGGTVQLTTMVRNAAGETLAVPVTFTSSNTAIATVTGDGVAISAGPVGSATITATAGSISSQPIVLAVVAGPAASVVADPALAAVVQVGSSANLLVRVRDAHGNPVVAATVTYAATGATVSGSASAVTDLTGLATKTVTFGTTPGLVEVTASVGDISAKFVSSRVHGPAAKLSFATAPSSSVASRSTLSAQPIVRVEDSFGNLVSSTATVTASIVSGATLSGTTSRAAVAGTATFTDLVISGATGTKTLRFSSTGLTALDASVTLTAGAPSAIAVASGNNAVGYVDSLVTSTPTVRVTDADGNNVAGVSVTFGVTGGGGSLTGATSPTTTAGLASVGSWRLGGSGTNQLTATSAALPGQSASFSAVAFDPPTACGQTAFLTLGRTRDGNMKASVCALNQATMLGLGPFTGPQAGGTYFYDAYLIDVPANTIVEVRTTRGTFGSGEQLLLFDMGGAHLDDEFLDPLIINNSTAATVRYQVLLTNNSAGRQGTYTIRANLLVGGGAAKR